MSLSWQGGGTGGTAGNPWDGGTELNLTVSFFVGERFFLVVFSFT